MSNTQSNKKHQVALAKLVIDSMSQKQKNAFMRSTEKEKIEISKKLAVIETNKFNHFVDAYNCDDQVKRYFAGELLKNLTS